MLLHLYTQNPQPFLSFPSALKDVDLWAQNQVKMSPFWLKISLICFFYALSLSLYTLTACRVGSRLNFVSTKSFSQEAHAKRFMGRSSARGELLNFLQTASFWREKASPRQRVYMQTVSGSSEMLVRAKPNI